MKMIEENGKRYIVWENTDEEARRRFEIAVSSSDEKLVGTLFDAITETLVKAKLGAAKAWNSIRDAFIGQLDGAELTYDWCTHRFLVKPGIDPSKEVKESIVDVLNEAKHRIVTEMQNFDLAAEVRDLADKVKKATA